MRKKEVRHYKDVTDTKLNWNTTRMKTKRVEDERGIEKQGRRRVKLDSTMGRGKMRGRKEGG